jgi:tetratricopeptide (TPR) repeat protein
MDLSASELAREIAAAELDAHIPLRLTVARGALGLELYERVEIGPLEVAALSLTLPGLRFPLDLGGGVRVFRHRRGNLEHARLELGLDALARWLGARAKDVAGPLVQPVVCWSIAHGIGVGLVTESAVLAFDVLWAPNLGDARFVVDRVRAVGLPAPALGHALRLLDTVFGKTFVRRGRILELERGVYRLGCAVLPAIGTRAPAADRARFGDLSSDGDLISLEVDTHHPPPALGERVARALELGELVAGPDDLLARGELDDARNGYLTALEQAPRHPEIVRAIAEIDVCAGDRAEAALGLIVETLPATQAGLVGAELLARVGDVDGAKDAIAEAARREPFAPLAASLWLRLSELELSAPERVGALDRAVAAAPGLARARWARFQSRVDRSELEGAIADAEHLEAAAIGARARHETSMRAARRLLESGFVREGGRLFERALRYVPDDASATAGLARALLESGRTERAYALLARAITLAERTGTIDADALVDLARLLALSLRDLPQAIARIREVPASSPRGVEARALEAGWRASLGDLSGASLAYARMRDAIELGDRPSPAATEWLLAAARFEREVQRDVLAAERHLALAVRLAPHSPQIGEAYREVAALCAARARRQREGDGDTGEIASDTGEREDG